MSSEQVTPDSTYPALERPEFKSQIPEHLLANVSDSDRFIMEELSKFSQFAAWSVEAQLTHDRNLKLTNGTARRAKKDVEEFRRTLQAFTRGWKFVVIAIGAFMGIVEGLYYVIEIWRGH